MRSCDLGVPAAVAGKTLSLPATQPTSVDRKLAACGWVIDPTLPFLVRVEPELVAMSQGAVPAPQAEHQSMKAAFPASIAENGPASEPGDSATGFPPGVWKYCSAKIGVAPAWSAWKPTCGSWLIAAPGPTRMAQAEASLAHSTLMLARTPPEPACPLIDVRAVQSAPPSVVR